MWRSLQMQYLNVIVGLLVVLIAPAFGQAQAQQQHQQQRRQALENGKFLPTSPGYAADSADATTSAADDKLKVLVLYESLCPDSIRFMREQLATSYNELKDYIDIQLVPFGKAHSQNNGAHFYCQHGPAECEGNRLQSCVLHQTDDQIAQVKFVVCQMLMQQKNSIKYCAESVGLSADVRQCMQTNLGTALQLQAEAITHKYAPRFIPTIIYEQVFDQRLQDRSIRNFRATVCDLLQQRGAIDHTSNICQ